MYKYLMVIALSAGCIQGEDPKPDSMYDTALDSGDTGLPCMPEAGPMWYFDGDGDGYGMDESSVRSCRSPSPAHQSQGGDCDDTNRDVYPNAPESTNDGVDSNCDGTDN